MQTTPSNVASVLIPQRPRVSGYSNTATTSIALPVTFEIVPLLRGFCARLSCPVEGWFKSYGAREIRLDYHSDSADFEPQSVEIYTVEDEQNMSFQKTVLGLGANRAIQARFVLLGENGAPVFVSTLQNVETLS
jgi:hypothetical protein